MQTYRIPGLREPVSAPDVAVHNASRYRRRSAALTGITDSCRSIQFFNYYSRDAKELLTSYRGVEQCSNS